MKLPRNARIFQGQLDVAPFAGVFFLLLMFILFGSSLVHNPGVRIELPTVPNPLPGTPHPAVAVALDSSGRLFFESQVTTEEELLERLRGRVAEEEEALTLVLRADGKGPYENVVRVQNIAQQAGVREVLLEVEPYPYLFQTNGPAWR